MMVVECFIFIVFPVAKGSYLIVVFIWADILHYCPTGLFVFEVLCVPATIREHLKNRQQNRILL